MSRRSESLRRLRIAAVAGLVATSVRAAAEDLPQVGRPAAPADLAGFLSIHPDGRGLPPGSGTVAAGRAVFEEQCASCHGDHLQGGPRVGAPALTGGRGTLLDVPPTKTVESYWPYATTLFDYIKRAMPFNAPGSLSDAQVYAVCAFILAQDGIVAPDAVVDRDVLAGIAMPNRDGFRPASTVR